MNSDVKAFAEVAEKFCTWAEGEPMSPQKEAIYALQLLAELYQQGLQLPKIFGDEESAEISHEDWSKVYKRFGALPFNYYMQCLEPQNVPDDLPGVADLADDLADIWRDLKRGLDLFNSGFVPAAVWDWRQSFWTHWGRHATGSLFALHNWLSTNSNEVA